MPALLGWGDLARCWAVHGVEGLAAMARFMDWKEVPREAGTPGTPPWTMPEDQVVAPPPPTPRPGPTEEGVRLWRVRSRRRLDAQEQARWRDAEPDWVKEAERTPPEPEVSAPMPSPGRPSLVLWRRLWPFLRSALGDWRPLHRPDLVRLVALLAGARPVQAIPWQRHWGWASSARILVEADPRLQVFSADQVEVLERFRRLRGGQGLAVIPVDARLRRESAPASATPMEPRQVCTIYEQGPVLVLGDLGLLTGDRHVQGAWADLGRRLRRAGSRVTALVPCPCERWSGAVTAAWRLAAWDRGVGLSCRQAPRAGFPPAQAWRKARAGGRRLLALLSTAIAFDGALVRALRLELAGRGERLGVDSEFAALWHPAIIGNPGGSVRLDADHARDLRAERGSLPAELRALAAALIAAHHATWEALLKYEEHATCRLADGEEPSAETRAYYQRLFVTVRRGGPCPTRLRGVLRRAEERLPEQAWKTCEGLAALWELTEGSSGRPAPAGLERQAVAWVHGRMAAPRTLCVWQQGEALMLASDDPAGITPRRGAPLVRLAATRDWLHWSPAGGRGPSRLALDGGLVSLAGVSGACLASDREEVVITVAARQDWCSLWERGSEGVMVETELPAIGRVRVAWPEWASQLDRDPFGLVATLSLPGGIGCRLRWIPPGRFQMGSPKGEVGRFDVEGPQHWVTLTRGFWLAETPCTQAQWAAVMGSNPSHFQGEDRPVETVSWDDCQAFCERLRQTGCEGRLPTEAEWEYACRAGTTSAFNDGSACTVPGDHDPALETLAWHGEGLGGQTHPVRQKRPNAWGLYDMHGNVWEWCQDWFGAYRTGDQTDPIGPDSGVGRVERGGSCWVEARRCRSAYRGRVAPGNRNGYLGFRLAAGQLKGVSQVQFQRASPADRPSPEAERPAEPVGAGTGSRGSGLPPAASDEKPSESEQRPPGLLDRLLRRPRKRKE